MAMAKSKKASTFWGELLKFELYKRNQGRLVRQATVIGCAIIVFFGAWTLSQGPLAENEMVAVRVGIPLAICVLGVWIAFRAVNFPRFADFLISVEAELDKVSWASRDELFRATTVVMSTMFFIGFVLFVYDVFWKWFFEMIGFLQTGDL